LRHSTDISRRSSISKGKNSKVDFAKVNKDNNMEDGIRV
jgi:hypothetical protein